jgi:hypothetical protein
MLRRRDARQFERKGTRARGVTAPHRPSGQEQLAGDVGHHGPVAGGHREVAVQLEQRNKRGADQRLIVGQQQPNPGRPPAPPRPPSPPESRPVIVVSECPCRSRAMAIGQTRAVSRR